MHGINLLVILSILGLATAVAIDDTTIRRRRKKRALKNKLNQDKKAFDEDDIAFWTRLLQGARGKETEVEGGFSIPPRPPSGGGTTAPGTDAPDTPNPTPRPTPRPTRRNPPPTPTPPTPTPPSPTPPTFNCPPTDFVGCTAPDPSDPQDECSAVGEPCTNGNPGEFCCRDACPRFYCTAKEAP